nr:uncharacterized protein LOC106689823 [Halyomorpha halys]
MKKLLSVGHRSCSLHTGATLPSFRIENYYSHQIHADKTKEYLKGKKLLDEETLKGALFILESELIPNHILANASPEFRKVLALSLFYKFVVSVAPGDVQKYRSSGPLLERPVSQSKQHFDTDSTLWPLSKPIPKIESIMQCSAIGEPPLCMSCAIVFAIRNALKSAREDFV